MEKRKILEKVRRGKPGAKAHPGRFNVKESNSMEPMERKNILYFF